VLMAAEVVLGVGPVGAVTARPVAWGSRRFRPSAASSMASPSPASLPPPISLRHKPTASSATSTADFPPSSPLAPQRLPTLRPPPTASASGSRQWRLLPTRAGKEGGTWEGTLSFSFRAPSARHL
jgi:hypothetical protein